jgi:DNA-binding NtrC family response regulator
VIDAEHLWLDPSSEPAASSGPVKTLAELEREGIIRALDATDGNRRKAAELLGIGERTLYDKLKRHELS